MKRTYKRICTSNVYSAEIYGGCKASFEIRDDGNRARLTYDTTVWTGSTGGLKTKSIYFEDARKALRIFRKRQIAALKNGAESKNDFHAFLELAELHSEGYIK
jgi:hypothetical protein